MREVQLDLPITLDAAGGIDEVYRDQGDGGGGVFVHVYYSKYGIQGLDADFTRQILEVKTERQRRILKWRILKNPHLHAAIKQNLIYNLMSRILR